MPFTRPSLTELRNQVAQDIAGALPGSDPLLRFSNLSITGKAQAGLAHQHYGYLDWIAKQAVPWTATGEYLEGWAALKKVYRKAAKAAVGSVAYPGTNGTLIPAGTSIVRGDGAAFVSVADTLVSGGLAVVPGAAVADSTGQTGAWGNTAAGTVMTLGQTIPGIQSNGTVVTAFIGGADLEKDDSLRARMLEAYQNPPQGGDKADYEAWALAVPGVTRAWCVPNGFGSGTVVVYVMLDSSESAHGGFPQGTNGVAAVESRGAPATGDQLTVANAIYLEQPVTALVHVVAPTGNPVDFTIKGIPAGSQSLISPAIGGVFLRDGVPGGGIALAHIWSAIAAVTGVNDFVIQSPTADITNATGQLPTVGTLTFVP